MREGDVINKKYWTNAEPEQVLAGLSFPGSELTSLLRAGDTVLDVGCGAGKVSEFLAGKGYVVTGIDINEKALQEAGKRTACVTYLMADVTDMLPFGDNSFDAIVVSYVFVSIIAKEKQRVAAGEIQRVLKKGGCLWLCEATYSPDYIERYKKGKKILGEDFTAVSLDERGQIKRVIRHYREEDLDALFGGLSKIESSKIVVQSPSSGMNVESLRMVYRK